MITAEAEIATVAAGEQLKPSTKASGAKRARNAATKKGKPGKKANPAKKVGKGAQKGTGARAGSKAAKVLDLLKRPEGATLKDLMKATSWQSHSVRGFLSGAIGKKMGLMVTSTKDDAGERTYFVKP